MGWIAGWNMPGYLPESDPETFEDWHAAHSHIVEAVERFWDEDTDTEGLDEDGEWLPAHTALHVATTDQPYAVSNDSGRLVLWVDVAECEHEVDFFNYGKVCLYCGERVEN